MGTDNMHHDTGQNALTLGLSLLTGLGLTLMLTALAAGVILGDSADGDTIGLLFIGGISLFIVGAIAWGGVVQPWAHFDDINVPKEDDHHGHDDHEETH